MIDFIKKLLGYDSGFEKEMQYKARKFIRSELKSLGVGSKVQIEKPFFDTAGYSNLHCNVNMLGRNNGRKFKVKTLRKTIEVSRVA